jgi:hypothetical protein
MIGPAPYTEINMENLVDGDFTTSNFSTDAEGRQVILVLSYLIWPSQYFLTFILFQQVATIYTEQTRRGAFFLKVGDLFKIAKCADLLVH